MVSIFIDLEKAYDTTSKYGIMKDVYDMDLEQHLLLFIQNFSSEKESESGHPSVFYDEEMEFHIHEALYVYLFIVKIIVFSIS